MCSQRDPDTCGRVDVASDYSLISEIFPASLGALFLLESGIREVPYGSFCQKPNGKYAIHFHIDFKFVVLSIGEGEVAVFSDKRWDRRNKADLMESATPCHDALPRLERTPPDCSGCKVRGLHHCATTPSPALMA